MLSGETGPQTWAIRLSLCGDSHLLSQSSRGREEDTDELKDSLGYMSFRQPWAAVTNPVSKRRKDRLGAVQRVTQAPDLRAVTCEGLRPASPLPRQGFERTEDSSSEMEEENWFIP